MSWPLSLLHTDPLFLNHSNSDLEILLGYLQHKMVKSKILEGTKLRDNFFSPRVVNLWNSLPGEVKNARNPKMFKNIYQRFAGDIV